MREIDFRAWLKDEKRMITKISSIKLDINCIYYDNNQLFSYERASFDDIEFMQYTGRKDKNRKKIFEQDVVKLNGYLWEVYWSDEESCFKMKNKLDDLFLTSYKEKNLEVIGNIYENPELLGEKNEKN